MTISYAITVCTELEEIKKLLEFLSDHIRKEDEIVVLFDSNNGSQEVDDYLDNLRLGSIYSVNNFKICRNGFKGNFAEHKNYLNSLCSRDYIFQIDSDELPDAYLIDYLPIIIEMNNVDAIWIPRINIVKDITDEYITQQRWTKNTDGWINWPNDAQLRLYRNESEIKWEGKVHEKIVGYKTIAKLPDVSYYALWHIKSFDKQKLQNEFYNTL